MPSASTSCREEEFIECLASITNDIVDLQYSDIISGGDLNVDFASSCNLCSNLQHLAKELGLKFVFDKLPHDSMATFRVESTGATFLIVSN